ncbi:MAG: circularly permuted type 2 ATP-grasp protein, partial [Cohnella sp.]|nr:circularly permuted type 2 ATP-grasp protein [Cohnella sp.]
MGMTNEAYMTSPSSRFYNEMYDGSQVRGHYGNVHQTLSRMTPEDRITRQQQMNGRLLEEGITFTLSGSDQEALERTIPFDLVPRIIPSGEWSMIEQGTRQRIRALNAFLADIYHEQCILKDGIVPRRMVLANRYFRTEMMKLPVPGGTYVTASGIDLIRDEKGDYFVLEDNLRSPSGFSYVFKSRSIMTHDFPELYFSYSVRGIDQTLLDFRASLRNMSLSDKGEPVIALLTPGSYNSAYFEHT